MDLDYRNDYFWGLADALGLNLKGMAVYTDLEVACAIATAQFNVYNAPLWLAAYEAFDAGEEVF